MPSDPKVRSIRLSKSAYRELQTSLVWDHSCLLCPEQACTVHHLVPRSLGGDDILENLVPLCGDGTRGCHGLVEANDKETRQALRRALSGYHLDYITATKSPAFLDAYYPA